MVHGLVVAVLVEGHQEEDLAVLVVAVQEVEDHLVVGNVCISLFLVLLQQVFSGHFLHGFYYEGIMCL